MPKKGVHPNVDANACNDMSQSKTPSNLSGGAMRQPTSLHPRLQSGCQGARVPWPDQHMQAKRVRLHMLSIVKMSTKS